MAHAIELSTENDQLAATILLAGDFDVSVVHAFHDELLNMDQRASRSFEINCKDLEYIDVAGMQLLLALKTECNINGRSFEISELPASLRDSMDAIGLGQLLFA
ncbi:MAG: STAS domain-containing protein [Pirellulaceae bacterium]